MTIQIDLDKLDELMAQHIRDIEAAMEPDDDEAGEDE